MWPSVVLEATDTSTDPDYGRTMDPDMVLGNGQVLDVTVAPGGSLGLSGQYISQLQHDPQTSTGPQVVAHTLGICTAFGGNGNHRYQPRPWLSRARESDSPGSDITMVQWPLILSS